MNANTIHTTELSRMFDGVGAVGLNFPRTNDYPERAATQTKRSGE
jgi:hypothetical protein